MKNVWKPAMLSLLLVCSTIVILNCLEEASAYTDRYVDSSGGTPYQTISQAYTASVNGDIIHVAVGNGYSEALTIAKSITITGPSSGTLPVVTPLGGGSTPVFDIVVSDVTILNLEIDGQNTGHQAGIRSGVAATEVSNIEIGHCNIYDFDGDNTWGSAILIKPQDQDPVYPTSHFIHDCIQSGDANFGLSYNQYGIRIVSDPEIEGTTPNHIVQNCNIHHNHRDGINNYGDNNYFDDVRSWSNIFHGVYLDRSEKCYIEQTENGNASFNNNQWGIYLDQSNSNYILGYSSDTASDMLKVYYNTAWGIYFDSGHSNQIMDSLIFNNAFGFISSGSDDSYLCNNQLKNNGDNGCDIYLYSSDDNHIFYCDIRHYTDWTAEIALYMSSGNYIEHIDIKGEINLEVYCDSNVIGLIDDCREIWIDRGDYNRIHNSTITNNNNNPCIKIEGSNDIVVWDTSLYCGSQAFYIIDSTSVYIDGCTDSEENLDIIDDCNEYLRVESDSVNSTVEFSRYSLNDVNDQGSQNDILMCGSGGYYSYGSTEGGFDINFNQYEVYTDPGCSWT